MPYILALLLTLAAAWTGLTAQAGAHPALALQQAMVGAPIGAVLALALSRTRTPKVAQLMLWAVLLLAAFAMAALGKQRFVASYAEDAFAGHLWHYGWIAALAALTALNAVVLSRR
ncbi:MAG: hypothetical protein HKN63_11775 [Rhodobacteraceae bacterium]|nr:hypothetical protein [Paracoccaceae bacterium]